MKIVHCIYSFHTGGAETMLIDILNAQIQTQQVSLIIVNKEYNQSLLDKIDKKVRIIKLGRPTSSRNPWYFVWLNILLLSLRVDVVHLHSASLIKMIFALQDRLYYTCHTVGIKLEPHKVAKVFAISQTVADDLRERYRCSNIKVVHNGIHLERIIPKTNHIMMPSNIKIVNVARLDHKKKGQDMLIHAIALLKHRGIKPISVDFIGEGLSLDTLRNLTIELGVDNQVRFLGLRDRDYIYKHLCDYDIMCHPSRFEGFGLTVVEGMAAKLPILVATGDGPYEIIAKGKYGYAFERDNVESCANVLADMIEHYDKAVAKAETSWEYAHRTYSVQNMVRQYIEAYTD